MTRCFFLLPLSRFGVQVLGLFVGWLASSAQAAIMDWEQFPLAANSAWPATSAERSPLRGDLAAFNRTWNQEFDCCPSGWAVSNQRDQVTAGPTNAYSAVVRSSAGGGHGSDNFGVANNQVRGESTVHFDVPVEITGAYFANVTYTYLAVVDGNDGAGFVKGPFVAGDWLLLEVIGIDERGAETGRVPLYLADYRTSPSRVVDEWTYLDLSSLGSPLRRLEFEMSSSDTGPFGMNTPAYFAIDELTYQPVPEPTAGVMLGAGALVWLASRRGLKGRSS